MHIPASNVACMMKIKNIVYRYIVSYVNIDFVENVYDNVKNPLGFLCNKVSGFMGSNDNYSLDNQKLEALEEGRDEEENFGLED